MLLIFVCLNMQHFLHLLALSPRFLLLDNSCAKLSHFNCPCFVRLQIYRILNVTQFKCHWFPRKKNCGFVKKTFQALGHAPAHMVSCHSHTTEAWVQIPGQSCPYGIYGKRCGIGTGFPPIIVVYSCQYYSISAPYSYFIHLPLMLYDLHA